MTWQKCPRCELNYIQEEQKLCSVCKKEIAGIAENDDSELCIVCGERRALPGEDMCLRCREEEKALLAQDAEDEDGETDDFPEEEELEEEEPEECDEPMEIPLEELAIMEEELGEEQEEDE